MRLIDLAALVTMICATFAADLFMHRQFQVQWCQVRVGAFGSPGAAECFYLTLRDSDRLRWRVQAGRFRGSVYGVLVWTSDRDFVPSGVGLSSTGNPFFWQRRQTARRY